MRVRRVGVLLSAAALGAAVGLSAAVPAAADPATSTSFSVAASGTRYAGPAFDACTAPTSSQLAAWSSSPYHAVAVYFGGLNRSCAQPELTPGWVRTVSRMGWKLLPVYIGLQPSCGSRPADRTIDPDWAGPQGTKAGADAVAQARALAFLSGSALYLDIENYDDTNVPCRDSVLTFVSAFTRELHRNGFLAGVYANLASGATDLSAAYSSTSYARSDALWIARWDNSPSLTGWAGVPDTRWAAHQRVKQYKGDHDETYGGVTINIDSDSIDGPVATVPNFYTPTGSAVVARSAPSSSAAAVASYQSGSTIAVVCQTPGTTVGSSSLWVKLKDGSYVPASQVGPALSPSAPLLRCYYPYQVSSPSDLSKRSGPGVSYPVMGTLPNGSLAWIVCQRTGSSVGGTTVWNRLDDGRWVTDYYVATPSATGFSAPIPRC